MKTIKTLVIFVFFFFIGKHMFSQNTNIGSVDLNKKSNSFSLVSNSDTILVKIDKEKLEFNKQKSFLFIKTMANTYKLVLNGDTILIKGSKKKIKFSTGSIFFMKKKKRKNLILRDKDGKILVVAKFELKKDIVQYTIQIFGNIYLAELLSYSTYYLYTQSKNLKDANDTPYLFFIYQNF